MTVSELYEVLPISVPFLYSKNRRLFHFLLPKWGLVLSKRQKDASSFWWHLVVLVPISVPEIPQLCLSFRSDLGWLLQTFGIIHVRRRLVYEREQNADEKNPVAVCAPLSRCKGKRVNVSLRERCLHGCTIGDASIQSFNSSNSGGLHSRRVFAKIRRPITMRKNAFRSEMLVPENVISFSRKTKQKLFKMLSCARETNLRIQIAIKNFP